MRLRLLTALLFLSSLLSAQTLKRADSFFGIHFDFHAEKTDMEIGKTLTPEMIDSFLTIVKPDYVQIDCKGHPGYSSYPTKVGNQAGGYTTDILKMWREQTSKHQVALYVHYSGLMDAKAVQDHPEWARLKPDNTPDTERASVLGNYSPNLLIPQMKEISDYGINGAWIDGECWATQPDYSPQLLEQFKKETGITTIPRADTDPHYKDFIEFNRKAFRSYLKNYIDALHAYNPAFQVTSNWSFSSMMPEPVDVNVDYLSGDVAGQNCVYNAAFQARCMALQSKPWDLMAWGFTYDFSPDGRLVGPKSLVQLKQEAAEVMAMGGGFQAYFTQNRDGSIKPWYFNMMGQLGEFCRARQPFCKGAETIPQIGLWYSTFSKRNQTNQVYGWNVPNVEGNLSALLDGQNNVEILMDHQLKKKLNQYPLIVIPEWAGLKPDLKQQVLDYVNNGGNLLVIGARAVKEFEPQLGVTFSGTPESAAYTIGFDNQMMAAKTEIQYVKANAGTQVIGELYLSDDFRFPIGHPAATVTSYGKGKLAGFYIDLSSAYYNYQAKGFSTLLNKVLKELLPDPLVKVTGSDYVHTAVTQKEGKTFIHLINTAGSHFNRKVYEYDKIPATGDLSLEINVSKSVRKVTLQPEGRALKFKSTDGKVSISVPSVTVHSIVQLEFK